MKVYVVTMCIMNKNDKIQNKKDSYKVCGVYKKFIDAIIKMDNLITGSNYFKGKYTMIDLNKGIAKSDTTYESECCADIEVVEMEL